MRKRDTTADDGGFGPRTEPAGRVTPADVQQKEFRVARFGGGYRMREVDEFLDEITDTLSALQAENEELRAGRSSAPSPAAPRPIGDHAERGAVDAFLEREKGFLQSLGGLVQGHAEELKDMVRSARRNAAAPVPMEAADPAAPPPPAGDATVTAETSALEEPAVVPGAETTSEEPEAAADEEPAVVPEVVSEAETTSEEPEGAADEEPSGEEGQAEEPIRLEDPEPARSRRSEDDPNGSLRELFWGEE